MSVGFDPVRLGPRRRRIDPLSLGVTATVVALAVAVAKPWEPSTPPPVARALLAVAVPSDAAPSPRPTATARTTPVAGAARVVPIPTWADVRPVIETHDEWGVRAILVTRSPTRPPDGSTGYQERWSASRPSSRGVDTANLDPDDRSIVGLGITYPPSRTPIDARITRVHVDDDESIDTRAFVSGDRDGAFLFLRSGPVAAGSQAWAAGQYRIDVLTREGIHRIILRIQGGFEPFRLPAR